MSYTIEVDGALLTLVYSGVLTNNRVYQITLAAGISGIYGSGIYSLQNDYTFWYTSAYCPLFSTLTKVKLSIGPSADVLIDDAIYRLIHKNSMDIIDIYNAYQNTSWAYDYWGCTWHTAPAVFTQYVTCKTGYDILAIIELASTNNGTGAGGQLKTLGDMTIRYDAASAAAQAGNPGKKKELYDCWKEMVAAAKNYGIVHAVKGWYDTTKSFSHPTWDADHNRVIRTVDFQNSDPVGPWWNATYWRSNL